MPTDRQRLRHSVKVIYKKFRKTLTISEQLDIQSENLTSVYNDECKGKGTVPLSVT
jgi:hypothetical protein